VALTESQNPDLPARPPLGGLVTHIRARLNTWLADTSDRSVTQRVASAAFLIRVCSAALIYLSQIVLARWMGRTEFGIYVYVWTWVTLIGDMADLGLATAAQRFIPEYAKLQAFDRLRGFLARSRWLAVASASIIALSGILLVRMLGPYLDDVVEVPLMIACATLPFYSLMQMQDGIARSYDWIDLALLPPYIVRHVVMLVLILAAFLLSFETTAETAVTAVAISFALTVVGQTVLLNRRLARTIESGPRAYETKTWFKVSLPILMVEGFYVLLTSTDILVLQQFRNPDDVAIYYAAAKTLALIAFVHFAVSAAVAHRFSKYHIGDHRKELEDILTDSIRWTFWASLAACVVVLAMGQPLLWLFGPQFTDGFHLMWILAVGLMARASVGPIERLLNMLGEQRACAVVYAGAFALNLVLCVILVPRIGVEGAAVSTTTALIFESVLLFAVTRKRLGFHVFIWSRAKSR
jgi:O-antigen/teichoic acid export membrane protein